MPDTKITREQAITDLIESIALEESALSTILAEEGAKLKKVIEGNSGKSENHGDLLAVNKSVEDMIKTITKLEVVLQSKLELIENCICPPSNHNGDN